MLILFCLNNDGFFLMEECEDMEEFDPDDEKSASFSRINK